MSLTRRFLPVALGCCLLASTEASGQQVTVGNSGNTNPAGTDIGDSADIFFDVPQFDGSLGTLNSVVVRWFTSYDLDIQVTGSNWIINNLEYGVRTEVFGPGPGTFVGPPNPAGETVITTPNVTGLRHGATFSGLYPASPNGGVNGDLSPDTLEADAGSIYPTTPNGPGVTTIRAIDWLNGVETFAGGNGVFTETVAFVEGDFDARTDGDYGSGNQDFPNAVGSWETGGAGRESFTIIDPGNGSGLLTEYMGGGVVEFSANLVANTQGGFQNSPNFDNSSWTGSFRVEVVYNFTPVPEPSTYAMLGFMTLVGATFIWRSRQVRPQVAPPQNHI